MSRKLEFLENAHNVEAMAERVADVGSKLVLREAGECWRLLASLETGAPPTHWDHRREDQRRPRQDPSWWVEAPPVRA